MRASRLVTLVGMLTAGCLLAFVSKVAAQGTANPWAEPQDARQALFEPDGYAWRLFVALNWPADVRNREPDVGKVLGAPGSVVWEVWRNVNKDAPDPVFTATGADPGPWLTGPVAVASVTRRSNQFEPFNRTRRFAEQATRRPGDPATAFVPTEPGAQEVRMNRQAYTFVRDNGFYRQAALRAAIANGKPINFPAGAKEVKAVWSKLDNPADKDRYHWAEVVPNNGAPEVWGLIALHITTKDIPQWFWATFEHIDNKTRRGRVNWQTASVDRAACPAPPHGCDGVPQNLGLAGTKWANYRLRGTQTNFTDMLGNPTILANAQIEPQQQTSSCMTCHARAGMNREGEPLSADELAVGAPKREWYFDRVTGQQKFMQLDFAFTLQRAYNGP